MTNWNPTRNTLVGAAALGLLALVSNTQYAAGADSSTPSEVIPYSVTAEAGTTGIGGNGSWRFMDYLGADTGYDFFSFSYAGTIKDNRYNVRFRLMSEPLNLDVYPWERSSFHIALGALFNENRLSGNATGSVNLGSGTPSYPGSLNLVYKPNVLDPYVGIGGNLYFDHAHHWSVLGALGVAYAGDGTVTLVSSPDKYPVALENERNRIKSYTRDLSFWPVAKIGLTYSF